MKSPLRAIVKCPFVPAKGRHSRGLWVPDAACPCTLRASAECRIRRDGIAACSSIPAQRVPMKNSAIAKFLQREWPAIAFSGPLTQKSRWGTSLGI